MKSLNRIAAIVVKEIKQLRRDRMTFGMVVMIPLIQLLMFGYAINTDPRHLPSGLVDHSQSSYGRLTVQALQATQVVKFTHRYATVEEAEEGITRGEVKAVLNLPRDFTRRLIESSAFTPGPSNSKNPARPVGQWLVDGSDTMVTGAIRALRAMPLNEIAGRNLTMKNAPSFEVVQYFNPEQRAAVNIVPGLLAVILTMTMVLFTSIAIVREREQGNIEFLITTPVKPIELMIGKIIPYIAVGLIQSAILLGLGYWVFDVPIGGGLLELLSVTLLFIFASLTLGLFISTIAHVQLQAMQMTIFVMLPSILLSGFMFPYEAMPLAAQYIAEALPATHFMRLIRGVVLRDAGFPDLMSDMLWLAGFSAAGLTAASLRFKKRLD